MELAGNRRIYSVVGIGLIAVLVLVGIMSWLSGDSRASVNGTISLDKSWYTDGGTVEITVTDADEDVTVTASTTIAFDGTAASTPQFFLLGGPLADLNSDGVINSSDFSLFFTASTISLDSDLVVIVLDIPTGAVNIVKRSGGAVPNADPVNVDVVYAREVVSTLANSVTVTSSSDPTGIVINVTEDSAASGGSFSASVTLISSGVSSSTANQILVADGDTVNAEFHQSGDSASALVESSPPQVTVLSPLDDSKTFMRRPAFHVEFTDSQSGVDIDTILFTIDGVAESPDEVTVSGGIATASFMPSSDLSPGSPEEAISWSVSATDMAGNSMTSPTFIVVIDRVGAVILSAETGTWWDVSKQTTDKTTTFPDNRNSVVLIFSEPLEPSSVTPTDFTVNGLVPIAANVYPGVLTSVFLTMAVPLESFATPGVLLVSPIADSAGNTTPVDSEVATDGISPGFEATLSASATNDSVDLVITSDEALQGNVPTVTMTEPGGSPDAISLSGISIVSPNTWSMTIDVQNEGLADGDQAIKIVGTDAAGNQTVYGGTDPTAVGYPVELALSVDTAFSPPVFNPTGPPVSFTYTEPVSVTAATFNGSDVLGDLVSSDQITFELQEPGLPPGSYQIVVSAADAAGNVSLGDSASIEIIGVPVSGSVSLQLQSTVPQTATGNSIATVRLYVDGASTSTQATDVAANGSFTFIGVPEGTYDLVAEAFGFLSARLEDVAVGGTPVSVGSTTLPIGDINDDGSVAIQNISGAASNFGSAGPVAWSP